jgi:hypothetical protein
MKESRGILSSFLFVNENSGEDVAVTGMNAFIYQSIREKR